MSGARTRNALVILCCCGMLAACGSTPERTSAVPDLMRTIRAADDKYHNGKLEEAEQLYKQVLAIEPRYVDAHLRLGVIAYRRNDYQAAEEKFRDVLKSDPRHLSALYNLAAVQMEQAHRNLELYLQLSPPKADQRTQVRELITAIEAFAKRE